MDAKTTILLALLLLGLVLSVAGTYYQTIVLESFAVYTEGETNELNVE